MEGTSGNIRALLGNPNITLSQARLTSCLISLDLKPQDDPVSPPYMTLNDNSTEDNSQCQLKNYNNYVLQETKVERSEAQPCRDRTHSADWQYSILAFLNRKIRERVMSEQLKCSNHF